ncbi:MAG: prepilin-type N-terminal cleavage/methylation domain-containing protein [Acidobacteria bacterium]|nr:prepilin-type N-terminal cleavage/methylation domain-containing protein [Acidobacteriota bacterium]
MTRKDQLDEEQAGFSLIELMVALVATMIIAAAIFGLLTAGNTAFRREPELADRQQNIRIAMSVIADDIMRAGSSMPAFLQVFTDGLNGAGPMGSSGQATDELQLIAASDCQVLRVCRSDGVNVVTGPLIPTSCYALPNVVFLVDTACTTQDNECAGVYWAEPSGDTSSCPGSTGSGTGNGHVNLPPGQAELVPNPPGGPAFNPNFIGVGSFARYRIRTDAEGTPNLERSNTGGINVGTGNTWEIVARGIEDLQIEYLNGTGAASSPAVWTDNPGLVTCAACPTATMADYNTIVQRVRVRLSARALAPNLQGQTGSTGAGVPDAVRGELISEFAPKAAAMTLAIANREL